MSFRLNAKLPNTKNDYFLFQWRIMSLAEFGFVSCVPGHSSSRFSDTNSNYKSDAQRAKEEKEKAEKRAREEAARKLAEEEKKRQGNYLMMFSRIFSTPAFYSFSNR